MTAAEIENEMEQLVISIEDMGVTHVHLWCNRYSRDDGFTHFFSWTVFFTKFNLQHHMTDYSFEKLISRIQEIAGMDADVRELLLSL